MALDSCFGDQIRKKDEIMMVVKELLEDEKLEILAHVRDLVYTEGRRGSADELEMGALRATGRETS